jgi:hypothetical protein
MDGDTMFSRTFCALVFMLSSVAQTAAQATGAEPVQRIEAAMTRLAPSPVGAASLPVGAFRARGEGWREAREWRDDSREARCSVAGCDIVLLLDWSSNEPAPCCLAWGSASDAAKLRTVELAWKSPKGAVGFSTSTVPLVLEGITAASLRLTVKERAVEAVLSGEACYESRFESGGRPQLAWFVDADFDGRMAGPGDRWIAGPAELLGKLQLANPREELRPLDEGWCLDERNFDFVSASDGRVSITAGPPGDRGAQLARHHARVQKESVVDLPERRLLVRGQGDDPERPVAASPRPWYFVRSVAEAMDRAREDRKPLLVEFTSMSCFWCRLLTHVTHQDAAVDELLGRFTCAKILCDFDADRAYETHGVKAFPCTILFAADGSVIDRCPGFSRPSAFAVTLEAWSKRAAR